MNFSNLGKLHAPGTKIEIMGYAPTEYPGIVTILAKFTRGLRVDFVVARFYSGSYEWMSGDYHRTEEEALVEFARKVTDDAEAVFNCAKSSISVVR